MDWTRENTRTWRIVILVLLVLAIMGPWGFDRTNVPAEFACNPPHIRLEGDFCGSPISGIRSLSWMFIGIPSFLLGWFTGEIDPNQALQSFGFILATILLLLPIFNLLFILIRGAQPRFQKYHLVVCGLDFSMVLILGILNHPKFFYALWGIWLYIGLMISILVLEGILLKYQLTETPKTG